MSRFCSASRKRTETVIYTSHSAIMETLCPNISLTVLCAWDRQWYHLKQISQTLRPPAVVRGSYYVTQFPLCHLINIIIKLRNFQTGRRAQLPILRSAPTHFSISFIACWIGLWWETTTITTLPWTDLCRWAPHCLQSVCTRRSVSPSWRSSGGRCENGRLQILQAVMEKRHVRISWNYFFKYALDRFIYFTCTVLQIWNKQ